MFRINLIYYYGEMVELYSINLAHLLPLQRKQLAQYLFKSNHKMFNSGQNCMVFSTLSKDSARAIHNWLDNLEWQGHVPAGEESKENLELMGYVCTSYWGPLCAPSQMSNGHPDYEIVDSIVKSGQQTPAEILNKTPADVTVSAEGYFCYLPE